MILIPVKNFSKAKQRLTPVLSPAERRAFALAMLEDVLAALAACSAAARVALVTGDAEATRLARQFSLQVIEDGANLGESEAIAMATRVCEEGGELEALVLPADIPLISPAEIERIFAMAPPAGTVIVPSREGRGSNAVLRRPASLFPLRFGDDSFRPHLHTAKQTGKPCVVLGLDGIALDVDRPADLGVLLATPGNTRAHQLAREWNISARLGQAAVPA